ncbi:MAG: 6-oxocyclohex-1-ene-1-carbonyl-CoA hydratase, partial [Rhodospirillales bacterium]
LVITDRYLDEFGRVVLGEPKTGTELEKGKEIMAKGVVDLTALDAKVEELCTTILHTFPDCFTKTIVELRKPKLNAWNANKENSRDWLDLNMMTEARTGFRAFNEGPKGNREIDFIALRQAMAAGTPWTRELIECLIPKA